MSFVDDTRTEEQVTVSVQPPAVEEPVKPERPNPHDNLQRTPKLNIPMTPDTIPPKEGPVRAYRSIGDGKTGYINRLLIGTATTGLLRVEWHQARMGQVIPTNYSNVQMYQTMRGCFVQGYMVADAQNLICAEAVKGDFEWLLFHEHDMIPQPDAYVRLNEYMLAEEVPVVSGLYYTRSIPSEPLIYRGRGVGSFRDFMLGDKVWCDGVPTGFLLIHMGIIRAMWDEAEEYQLGNVTTRRVFDTPRKIWYDPEMESFNTTMGTSDLDWCTRVMEGDYFRKAGWKDYAGKPYPFLVDTDIFVGHQNVDAEGRVFPPLAVLPPRRKTKD